MRVVIIESLISFSSGTAQKKIVFVVLDRFSSILVAHFMGGLAVRLSVVNQHRLNSVMLSHRSDECEPSALAATSLPLHQRQYVTISAAS